MDGRPAGPDGSSPLAPAVGPRRRRPLVVLALAVALVAALALAGYLLATTRAWQQHSADWESLSRRTGTQAAATQARLDAVTSDLATASSQLTAAQARIRALAGEKARLGDTTAASRQLADHEQRVSDAAGEVATALATCTGSQRRLIAYVQDAARYDAGDLARYSSQVGELCDKADAANDALQRELDR